MDRKKIVFILSLFLMLCLPFHLLAAKVLAPEKGGKGFQAVTLEQAKELHGQGANFIACHSHTTDFMKGHPPGTKHITCLVPKDHKRTGMPLSQINFDIGQLPDDKSVPIVTYCASNT